MENASAKGVSRNIEVQELGGLILLLGALLLPLLGAAREAYSAMKMARKQRSRIRHRQTRV